MAFNVNKFRGQFKKQVGLTSPAHFELQINPPNIIRDLFDQKTAGSVSNFSRDMSFLCERAAIPGRNINTISHRYYGQPRNYVQPVFSDSELNVVCIARRGMRERGVLQTWQTLGAQETTGDVGYYDDYVSKIRLIKYDPSGKPEAAYAFKDCFPVQLNSIDLDWGAQNQITKFAVTFIYRSWEQVPVQNTEATGLKRLFDKLTDAAESVNEAGQTIISGVLGNI